MMHCAKPSLAVHRPTQAFNNKLPSKTMAALHMEYPSSAVLTKMSESKHLLMLVVLQPLQSSCPGVILPTKKHQFAAVDTVSTQGSTACHASHRRSSNTRIVITLPRHDYLDNSDPRVLSSLSHGHWNSEGYRCLTDPKLDIPEGEDTLDRWAAYSLAPEDTSLPDDCMGPEDLPLHHPCPPALRMDIIFGPSRRNDLLPPSRAQTLPEFQATNRDHLG